MIVFDGEKWTIPKYKITRAVVVYDDHPELYPDGVAEEVTLNADQKSRLEDIRYNTAMSMDQVEAYVIQGEGTPPDTRDDVDKLIDKLLELDPDGVVTSALIIEAAHEWQPSASYDRYVYVKHEGVLYKTIHPIRPHDTLPPPEAPHLYTRVGAIENGEIAVEEWRQPTGAHDAYKIGDKVLHNGKTWVCTLGDGAGLNSWEPGVYGWGVV